MAQYDSSLFAFDPETGMPRPRDYNEVLASRLIATPERYRALSNLSMGLPPGGAPPNTVRRPDPSVVEFNPPPPDAGLPAPMQGPPVAPPEPPEPELPMQGPTLPTPYDTIMQNDPARRPEQGPVRPPHKYGTLGQNIEDIGAGLSTMIPDFTLPDTGPAGSDHTIHARTDDNPDELWKRDPTQHPPNQPAPPPVLAPDAPVELDPITVTPPPPPAAPTEGGATVGGTAGLPYSLPLDRPQEPTTAAAGEGLPSVPSTATRTTGTSGSPNQQVTQSVDSANELNFVERKAADWFGIDTPEERRDARIYLAEWAANVAASKETLLRSIPGGHLAGLKGIRAEQERQFELGNKREEMDMRRAEEARRRTGEERAASQHELDMRNARGDVEWDEEQRRLERNNPFYGSTLAGKYPDEKAALERYALTTMPGDSDEDRARRRVWVEEQLLAMHPPPKAPIDPWAAFGMQPPQAGV